MTAKRAKPRDLLAELGELERSARGIARGCGWSPSRMPAAWRELPAGTAYDCDDDRVGTTLTRRGRKGRVVSCATPIPTPAGRGRARAYRCQGSLAVQFDGELFPQVLRRSVVREAQRTPREACDHAVTIGGGWVREWRELGLSTGREVLASGQVPDGDLPFPHRKAGHAACWYSELATLVREREESKALELARTVAPRARAQAARELRSELSEDFPPRVPTRAEVIARGEPIAAARIAERLDAWRAKDVKARELEKLRADSWVSKIDSLLGGDRPASYQRDRAALKRDQARRSANETVEWERGGGEVLDDAFAAELEALRQRYEVRESKGARR